MKYDLNPFDKRENMFSETLCRETETYFASENNTSRMAKLENIGGTCAP